MNKDIRERQQTIRFKESFKSAWKSQAEGTRMTLEELADSFKCLSAALIGLAVLLVRLIIIIPYSFTYIIGKYVVFPRWYERILKERTAETDRKFPDKQEEQ